MPVYEYRCHLCDAVNDHCVPMDDRLTRQDCPTCGKESCADMQLSAPLLGTEIRRGDSRLIRDERQVSSELGPQWRDQGTTGNPGGAGKRIHFHS